MLKTIRRSTTGDAGFTLLEMLIVVMISGLIVATVGSSIVATGTLKASEGQGQATELAATSVRLIGDAPSDYPLQKKRHTFEKLREWGHTVKVFREPGGTPPQAAWKLMLRRSVRHSPPKKSLR